MRGCCVGWDEKREISTIFGTYKRKSKIFGTNVLNSLSAKKKFISLHRFVLSYTEDTSVMKFGYSLLLVVSNLFSVTNPFRLVF